MAAKQNRLPSSLVVNERGVVPRRRAVPRKLLGPVPPVPHPGGRGGRKARKITSRAKQDDLSMRAIVSHLGRKGRRRGRWRCERPVDAVPNPDGRNAGVSRVSI